MKGFLFIGDPHVSSVRPGRRIDDYTSSVLHKLKVAGEIARANDWVPVILGDLFHKAGDNQLVMLSRLIAVLQSYAMTPVVVGGNHDKNETLLGNADALQILAQTGVVEVFDGECREAHRYEFNGEVVALWIAPYGATIPQAIEAPGADRVVLVTHHDLAFEGAYPGAAPLHEITGCSFVVNGHMHKTTPSVVMGGTVWHCPGNIEPLSIDCLDHVPAVWSWEPGLPVSGLVRHNLPHVHDCFDLTGTLVAAARGSESVAALRLPGGVPALAPTSHFAELLSAQTAMEGGKADDDETFVEEVTAGLEALKVSAPVKKLLMALTLRAPVPELNAEETQALLAQRPIVPIRDVEEAAPPLVISSAGF